MPPSASLARAKSRQTARSRPLVAGDYLAESRAPLASLVFLLPMIILYEIGTLVFARDALTGAETRIIAFNLLNDFLAMFGATGRYLPALAVVSILLWWHIARRDPWGVRPQTLGLMAVESVCWAVPLMAVAYLMASYVPLTALVAGAGVGGSEPTLAAMIVLSLGAGIYEELVFRLIAFAVLSFVLSDVLGVKPRTTVVITLLVSSVAFSLYHYLGWEQPHWQTFVFRTVAGFFFGALYLSRGFGVTAGSHAAYDVIVHCLRFTAF